ncbi:hypothetical protein [Cellvibrio japonicus]|uniref:hypothetical protein n=1 Tax=Cellvibrio japonicus TaxID=155077 RepID=UPI0011D045FC|nr:hypothetical protein [Cellvibrio japonicus]QEI13511.1 hypothetical protein FY117_15650 [Cellvibrio japonicus]QEI17085.1 hypothetical protein FY116_15655 [Cellvibrio japonicus]QEI20663.1 hypothetical protein FY115_15650 [Cellvibrio japonicus]
MSPYSNQARFFVDWYELGRLNWRVDFNTYAPDKMLICGDITFKFLESASTVVVSIKDGSGVSKQYSRKIDENELLIFMRKIFH